MGAWANAAAPIVSKTIASGTGFGIYNYLETEGGQQERAAALANPATFPAAARLLADHGVRPAEAAPEVLPKTDWAAAAA
jgi:hypothetical protein